MAKYLRSVMINKPLFYCLKELLTLVEIEMLNPLNLCPEFLLWFINKIDLRIYAVKTKKEVVEN